MRWRPKFASSRKGAILSFSNAPAHSSAENSRGTTRRSLSPRDRLLRRHEEVDLVAHGPVGGERARGRPPRALASNVDVGFVVQVEGLRLSMFAEPDRAPEPVDLGDLRVMHHRGPSTPKMPDARLERGCARTSTARPGGRIEVVPLPGTTIFHTFTPRRDISVRETRSSSSPE